MTVVCVSNSSIVVTTSTGSFKTANYPSGEYYDGTDCGWYLEYAGTDKVISLTVTVLSIGDAGDTITIYDTGMSEPIFYNTGSFYQLQLTLSGNSTFIHFKTNNNYIRGHGFEVSYYASVPGANVVLPTGSIATTNENGSPNSLVNNQQSIWQVQLHSHEILYVYILAPYIYSHLLEVYEGSDNYDLDRKMITMGLGDYGQRLYVMESRTNSFNARFETSSLNYGGQGFQLIFLPASINASTVCNGSITTIDLTIENQIYTPNYYRDEKPFYYRNQTCRWQVFAKDGYYIRMNVSANLVGLHDSLSFFDGLSFDFSNRFWHADNASSYYEAELMTKTTTQNISVEFVSMEDAVVGWGLKVTFEQVPVPTTPQLMVQKMSLMDNVAGTYSNFNNSFFYLD